MRIIDWSSDVCSSDLEVTNTAAVGGEEAVLLFVRDPVACVAQPLLELKGMARVVLGAGERRRVRLTLTTDDLVMLGQDLLPLLEPGEFRFFVGPSADSSRLLEKSVQVVDTTG